MTPELAVTLVSKSIWMIVVIVTALITPSLIVGLIVAVFQAVTQVNEQTLSFLPRLLVTLITIIFMGHWIIQELHDFFDFIMLSIPTSIG